jgi:short subunit dehydrogenase-like uncharacterized protein
MSWMIYGAYGYTGTLIAEEAVRRGHRPILGGRSEPKLRELGTRLGLDWRAFSLDDKAGAHRALMGLELLLNAAGPFGQTCRPMLDACLEIGTSYADIAGELDAFGEMFRRGDEAKRVGIAVVPGVGFDVVPTDSLAVLAARELPGATSLEIAVGTTGGASGGTLRTTVRVAGHGGRARRDGVIIEEPVGTRVLAVQLPEHESGMISAPLSDLTTAFHSTGIRNISTYLMVPASFRNFAAGAARFGGWLASFGVVRGVAEAIIGRFVDGPDEAARASARTRCWARATRGDETLELMLDAPSGYAYTQHIAVTAAERLLASRPTGVLSPAQAFGPEIVHTVPESRLWRRRGGEAWERL